MGTSPRIIALDIETTHLKSDFGTLLCFGYKYVGERRVYVPAIGDFPSRDPLDDRGVVAEANRVLRSADMLVSYYGKGFDIKWLQSKFLEYGLPPLPPVPHVDLFFTVKANLALTRKSLANVANYLELGAEKTSVTGRVWKRAMIGDKRALRFVVGHCRADVLLLEELYLKLRPLVRLHPRLGPDGCKTCGGQVTREKVRYTATGLTRYQYVCKACGSYETRSK